MRARAGHCRFSWAGVRTQPFHTFSRSCSGDSLQGSVWSEGPVTQPGHCPCATEKERDKLVGSPQGSRGEAGAQGVASIWGTTVM